MRKPRARSSVDGIASAGYVGHMGYFVTGGTGFIGRHLVAALSERGEPIYVLVRKSSEKLMRSSMTRPGAQAERPRPQGGARWSFALSRC